MSRVLPDWRPTRDPFGGAHVEEPARDLGIAVEGGAQVEAAR